MSLEPPVPIHGTHRTKWPKSEPSGELDLGHTVQLTAWLRPGRGGELDVRGARELGATLPSKRAYGDRAALERSTGADPEEFARFRKYCARHKIAVETVHWRSAVVSGSIESFVRAFGAEVARYVDQGSRHFRHRSGGLHAPPEIAAITRGVFGLHEWPRASRLRQLTRHGTPLGAAQVAQRYDFPAGTGAGQSIGIVQCHGQFRPGDFAQCMRAQRVTAKLPEIVRVDGSVKEHRLVTSSDLEAALDAQVAAALAPGARIVAYEAPYDERGILDAIRTAVFDAEREITVLSVSYGWPEMLWTPATLQLLDELFVAAALVGISVFCASGDDGAELDYDGTPHVVAPASSPFAIACGATELRDGVEIAWPHSGGGFSKHFASPPWHVAPREYAKRFGAAPGRGVPDVSALDDPGYLVYVDGVELEVSGTSAVAPVWAALTARVNEGLERPAGFFAPLLYAPAPTGAPAPLRDITRGGEGYYKARPGWDPCTGLGVPVGTALQALLRG